MIYLLVNTPLFDTSINTFRKEKYAERFDRTGNLSAKIMFLMILDETNKIKGCCPHSSNTVVKFNFFSRWMIDVFF